MREHKEYNSNYSKIDEYPALSCLFPQTFLVKNVAFTPWEKVYALHIFKMGMKQPILMSNDQD